MAVLVIVEGYKIDYRRYMNRDTSSSSMNGMSKSFDRLKTCSDMLLRSTNSLSTKVEYQENFDY
jgi:hypothetical protein